MGTPSDLAALNATGDQGRTGKPKYITDGADLGGADPATGVADLSGEPSREDSLVPMAAREDSNGDTYVGDTYNPPHGFLSRPQGWER